MRRRVVCPRSHPASLYVQGSFGALSRRLAVLAGGTPPETPQSAAPGRSSAKRSVKLGLPRSLRQRSMRQCMANHSCMATAVASATAVVLQLWYRIA